MVSTPWCRLLVLCLLTGVGPGCLANDAARQSHLVDMLAQYSDHLVTWRQEQASRQQLARERGTDEGADLDDTRATHRQFLDAIADLDRTIAAAPKDAPSQTIRDLRRDLVGAALATVPEEDSGDPLTPRAALAAQLGYSDALALVADVDELDSTSLARLATRLLDDSEDLFVSGRSELDTPCDARATSRPLDLAALPTLKDGTDTERAHLTPIVAFQHLREARRDAALTLALAAAREPDAPERLEALMTRATGLPTSSGGTCAAHTRALPIHQAPLRLVARITLANRSIEPGGLATHPLLRQIAERILAAPPP